MLICLLFTVSVLLLGSECCNPESEGMTKNNFWYQTMSDPSKNQLFRDRFPEAFDNSENFKYINDVVLKGLDKSDISSGESRLRTCASNNLALATYFCAVVDAATLRSLSGVALHVCDGV